MEKKAQDGPKYLDIFQVRHYQTNAPSNAKILDFSIGKPGKCRVQ
jgi:hypothetical protein